MPDVSAARHAKQAGDVGWLRTLAPSTRFVLQGGAAARAAASEAFGVVLPESPCRASRQADRAALWLGPNEHQLLGPALETQALSTSLESALADVPHSLVDVSHRQIALQVSGPCACAVLNTGCPLDLDLAEFPVGMCTRTLLGKADIVLWRTGPSEFHVEVWRSFSDYVSAWLLEAARDFIAPA